jgi:hypothetical protein
LTLISKGLAVSSESGHNRVMPAHPNIKESIAVLHNLLTETSLVLGTLKQHPGVARAAELTASALDITKDLAKAELRSNADAAALGSKGGKRTAERGPEYFAKIAAMRKTRSGGRPKKTN